MLTIKSTLLSLQGLFESPEPKDPQDAEVAKMMLTDREAFNNKAHEWAVRHAGAKPNPRFQHIKPRTSAAPTQVDESRYGFGGHGGSPVTTGWLTPHRYQGYNKDLIDRFVNMGFDIDRVVEAFQFVGIDRLDGQDYELEEAYMGDITARLLGEP